MKGLDSHCCTWDRLPEQTMFDLTVPLSPDPPLFRQVGVVNCAEETKLCAEYSARSQVSALLFPYGMPQKAKPKSYNGPLSKGGVVKWVKEHIPNHSIKLDPTKYESQLEGSSAMPRAILFSDKEKTGALWRALSTTFKDRVVLFDYHVSNSKVTWHPLRVFIYIALTSQML